MKYKGSLKEGVLEKLRETKGLVSGEKLGNDFGISRAMIWKIINQLRNEGYVIESERSNGYRLINALDKISEQEIQKYLGGLENEIEVRFFSDIDSTNMEAKRICEDKFTKDMLICAERQTQGRGRKGTGWSSPFGDSIYMSLLLCPKIPPNNAPMLTQVMALSVADAIDTYIIRGEETESGEVLSQKGDLSIKWPNDIIIGNKKVCGILTEMSVETNEIKYVVIGVGVNVNQDSFPEDIRDKATSLKLRTGNHTTRAELIGKITSVFKRNYEIFLETEDMRNLSDKYNELLVNKDKEVRVLDPKGEFSGVAKSINDKGELLIMLSTGEIAAVSSCEVSVRGLLGYV